MEFFRIKKDIPFMRHAVLLNAFSLTAFVLAVFFLVTRGLNLSVEFTGGTVLEVAYEQPADLEAVRKVITQLGYAEVPVQNFGTSRDVLMRLPLVEGQTSGQQSEAVLAALRADNPAVELRRTEFVGPQVGRELMEDGLKALAFVILGIMVYLAIRFEWKYAVAAIVANLHDVIIILGFFAFSSGNFRWRCWRRCWRFSGIRSTSRW
jgi:preprotein translocase subunit SecF